MNQDITHIAAECLLFEELAPAEFEAALMKFAALVAADYERRLKFTAERWEIECKSQVEIEREAILRMLKGIDETEVDSPDGWWETSTGAAFGASILAAIRARGQA